MDSYNNQKSKWTVKIISEEEYCNTMTQVDTDSVLLDDSLSSCEEFSNSKKNNDTTIILKDISSLKDSLDSISLQLSSQTEKINTKINENVENIEIRLNNKLQAISDIRSRKGTSTTCTLTCEIF